MLLQISYGFLISFETLVFTLPCLAHYTLTTWVPLNWHTILSFMLEPNTLSCLTILFVSLSRLASFRSPLSAPTINLPIFLPKDYLRQHFVSLVTSCCGILPITLRGHDRIQDIDRDIDKLYSYNLGN